LFSRPGVRVAAVTPEVAARASFLPGDLHNDPADRILVATAVEQGLRLVTRDRRLLAYGSQGYIFVLAC
jgi:PIN domain nuclease of toxin-antitoxin system